MPGEICIHMLYRNPLVMAYIVMAVYRNRLVMAYIVMAVYRNPLVMAYIVMAVYRNPLIMAYILMAYRTPGGAQMAGWAFCHGTHSKGPRRFLTTSVHMATPYRYRHAYRAGPI